MLSLCGIADTYTQGLDHNLMLYVRPSDNRVLAFPWDMDHTFYWEVSAPLWGDRNLRRIITRPPFMRMYYRHLEDIIRTTFTSAYMARWVTHYGAISGYDLEELTDHIDRRRDFVLSRLPDDVPFEITTGGGKDFAVEAETSVIEGTAPYPVAEIRCNGDPVDTTWSTSTRWRVEVSLASGPNELSFGGFDPAGNAVGTARITVTSTLDYHPPRIFMLTPVEGPSTGGTEVQLFGENFDPAARVRFGDVEAAEVEHRAAVQVIAVTPPGTGQVPVEIENPDGLVGTAPVAFAYVAAGTPFMRADANADGSANIADPVHILRYLFLSGDLVCRDAADVNDDGKLRMDDSVGLLMYLFVDGPPPPGPFRVCGADPTPDALDCTFYPLCP
jgi:hypothetical protein